MAKKIGPGGDPILDISYFVSGFYTYRSQLFAPYKPIGVNIVSFREPVLDGSNFEITDKFEWQRRPGFSIFCSEPLPDNEIVNQFYSVRNLEGVVTDFIDTSSRLATFNTTAISTLVAKSTTDQGYLSQVGQFTYFADGAAPDYSVWDSATVSAWGLAAPNEAPTVSGTGFWQPEKSFALGNSILDPNGNIEVVTAILNPNGTIYSPTSAENVALAGSLTAAWAQDPSDGGYFLIDGYGVVQEQVGYSGSSGTVDVTLPNSVTAGNVILVEIGNVTQNFNPSTPVVTDNITGDTYALQASGSGTYHAGGGNFFVNSGWVYSAVIASSGTCTVNVSVSSAQLQVIVREVSGISATASTSTDNYTINGPSAFNTGTITFTGTQFVLSTLVLSSPFASSTTPPVGYNAGAISFNASYLADAYYGETTTASPTWSIPGGNNLTLGLSVAFPISSITAGYTQYLYLYNFNSTPPVSALVPAGATITGVVLNVPKQNLGSGTVVDYSVKMVIGGVPTGVDHAALGAWSNSGFMVATYGTPTDTWGASPTAAEVNTRGATGFGFVISANITSAAGGSVIPEVGFASPSNPTLTIYYKQSNGLGGPGVSGLDEPIWAVTIGNSVNDGGLAWTNYGPIQTWFPLTAFTPPTVVLDTNGFLELATFVTTAENAQFQGNWAAGTPYSIGEIVYYGGSYWVSLQNSNTGITPSTLYTTNTVTGSTTVVQPWWAITTSPFTTGLMAPVWNLTPTGTTPDGSFTWENIGQGSQLASVGFGYVYGYRTIYGHLTTSSPISFNTGAILGPLNATISSYSITAGVVTFFGANNFLPGNVFEVQGLSIGTYLNNFSYTVISAVDSETLALTQVAITTDVLTITVPNNLVAGQQVTFSGAQTASFLNGVTVTVLSSGLSSSQFEANFTHANYGPTADTGNVLVIGSYTATAPLGAPSTVSLTLDSGMSIPLIATLTGVGTASPLANSTATITSVSASANIWTITAANNFQPGLYLTLSGLTTATFLNNQQVQVISVDQLVGVENTQFQFYLVVPAVPLGNYGPAADTGTATFNAVEIYRTSDGGGTYLFDGAVTNPGANMTWTFNDFVPNADLDIEQVAPLAHLNDPPPGAPGSTITQVGSVMRYWQGRLWLIVGNYVYFSAGPDCTNGIPEQAWPPSYRFQFAGQPLGLEPTADGLGMLVYLADRVNVIMGGPDTISFYADDALSNFGISNPNAIFRDGSTIGQFTTQNQYIELIGNQKQDIGEHIGDYLASNFDSATTYAALHRNGLDVGTYLSNGSDTILRYGSNISAWSVPYFPSFGAGAIASIETAIGIYSLMAASPTGGKSAAQGPFNPDSSISVAGIGLPWLNPSNVTLGSPTSYATVSFTVGVPANSQILLVSAYPLNIPSTAIVRGVTVTVIGKQSEVTGDLTVTIAPTNAVAGAESHTFSFGTTNTTLMFGSATDLWGMGSTWAQPFNVNAGAISFDLTANYTG